MKCPICQQLMKRIRSDSSYNMKENNKEYERVVYQCAKDDVWLTTEIPKDKVTLAD
jgi:uncharacterized Zn finger protein (UPF0148 family)